MPGPTNYTLPPEQLISLLQSLSDQIVSSNGFDTRQILAQAAPVFAALHQVNRNSLLDAKQCRTSTQDARLEMDAAHLRLQNLLFERNHLEREIKACEEYQSEYQNLPMHSLSELQQLASSSSPPEGLELPLPSGSSEEELHKLMLARLAFELAERKRFEEERKTLGTEKAKLIKENQVKKSRLEELEKQLTEFVDRAKGIQTKMNEEPAVSST
ncbi:uncharacterized protein JCM6883_005003 [Sporobolomyces salmoneus]|uniref:uncharacterized protein n=1 Tax=Sporobolomyces salmoneus TaxID=183962 RepID=UPI00317AE1D6